MDRGDWDKLDEILAESSREAADDLFPYYRTATRLIASGRERERAADASERLRRAAR